MKISSGKNPKKIKILHLSINQQLMKRFGIFIFLLTLFILTSCGRSEVHEKLIGKWRVVKAEYNNPSDPEEGFENMLYQNEFTGVVTEFTADQYKLRPEWKKTKTYSFNPDDSTLVLDNTDVRIKVKKVTDTELIVGEGHDGQYYHIFYYERLK